MFVYNISVDTTGANTTGNGLTPTWGEHHQPRPGPATTSPGAWLTLPGYTTSPPRRSLERGPHMTGVDRLTALDAETIVLLLSGYTVREIADRFNVTEKRIEKRRIRALDIITGKE